MNNINVGATASSGANAGVSVVHKSLGTGMDFKFTITPDPTDTTVSAGGSASFTEVSVTAPNTTSVTLHDGNNNTSWGTPKFNTTHNNSAHNDSPGFQQWNIPAVMKSAYISQLQWNTGGYADVHGVQTDGSLVFVRG